jgi:hypothetical protein
VNFPPDWVIRPIEDFDLTVASLVDSGNDLAVELLAKLHPTGHFRLSVKRTQILATDLDMA